MRELYKRIRLRDAVLRYFMEGRSSYKMTTTDDGVILFAGYTNEEVKDMLHALNTVGFLIKVSGNGPAAVFETTDDGRIMLEALQNYESV